MPLDTFVAGSYANTYNAVSVGITEEGMTLEQTLKEEVINESDAYGGATLDYIYRGGDAFLQYDCKAYKAGSVAPFWPWGGAMGQMTSASAVIARLASDVAAATVLSAAALTPAAAAPASITAAKSILAPGFTGRLLYNSKLRRVPVRLQFLPYTSSTNLVWWTQT